ncbi:MAG: tRNA (adenosine(37)-N6)-threonylcarbamoyltransferase complex dimerization subunit type 1 TsaB [Lachnospiraceae bacterium]|nr:tRNA (adenosine(37)-N6)-threonylcarbamoyltransferase complex dimerization subunit type 1 TsaB [Lachnospiraceae bacterium]
MKILAIDSSGLVASVAVAEDDTLLAEYTVNYKKTHSQTLLPMMDEVTRMIDLDLQSLDAIAVAGGPGSFTGLRIGSATAKGLGLALDLPLVSVPTVDALAWNLYGFSGNICPMMDARRSQVYTGIYSFEAGEFVTKRPQEPMAVADILQAVNDLGQDVIFLGDGVPVYREMILKQVAVPYQFAPAHLNRQRAASVAVLAMQYYKEGKIQTADEHKPEYMRLSQAERERAAQKKEEGQKV